jgi:broad specificity phosphatase PhoE
MQVIFVRHAQSTNNELKDFHSDSDPCKRIGRVRHQDPGLSDLGNRQREALPEGIRNSILLKSVPLKDRSPKKIRVAVSPMQRTLLTARPLIDGLQNLENSTDDINLINVEILPYIFEKGGCYTEDQGVIRTYPGLPPSEALELLPSATVHDDYSSGWWTGAFRESDEEFEQRVIKATSWITQVANENKCDVLILITHEIFGCACIRNFLGCENIDWLYNASFSSLTILPTYNYASKEVLDDRELIRVSVDYLNSVHHLPLELIS